MTVTLAAISEIAVITGTIQPTDFFVRTRISARPESATNQLTINVTNGQPVARNCFAEYARGMAAAIVTARKALTVSVRPVPTCRPSASDGQAIAVTTAIPAASISRVNTAGIPGVTSTPVTFRRFTKTGTVLIRPRTWPKCPHSGRNSSHPVNDAAPNSISSRVFRPVYHHRTSHKLVTSANSATIVKST